MKHKSKINKHDDNIKILISQNKLLHSIKGRLQMYEELVKWN